MFYPSHFYSELWLIATRLLLSHIHSEHLILNQLILLIWLKLNFTLLRLTKSLKFTNSSEIFRETWLWLPYSAAANSQTHTEFLHCSVLPTLTQFCVWQDAHWSDLIASKEKDQPVQELPETERKRREAVWELFKSECVFLVDHLMVLKHVRTLTVELSWFCFPFPFLKYLCCGTW